MNELDESEGDKTSDVLTDNDDYEDDQRLAAIRT